jgi:hypothetical protein
MVLPYGVIRAAVMKVLGSLSLIGITAQPNTHS